MTKMLGYVLRTEWFWAGALLVVVGGLGHRYAHDGLLGDVGVLVQILGGVLIGVAATVAEQELSRMDSFKGQVE